LKQSEQAKRSAIIRNAHRGQCIHNRRHLDEQRRLMSDSDKGTGNVVKMPAKVGYCSPPEATRFKPGQSGNPSGRRKGSQNFKTLFNKIVGEQVSLREGSDVKKVTKAEAVLRGLVVGALKGDPRNLALLLRLAEQAGGFEDRPADISRIERVIVRWQSSNEPAGLRSRDAAD
jgi:hypothetical protein